MAAHGSLTWIDWGVIGLYLLVVLGIGAWTARLPRTPRPPRPQTATPRTAGGATDPAREAHDDQTTQFFLGGMSMPAWAVAMSVLATALSAATFIAVPPLIYRTDLSYLILNLGAVLAALLVALWFLPAFYRARTITIYGYLGQRFGPPAGVASSVAFLVGRLLASAARLFIAGIVVALVLYGKTDLRHVLPAIILFGLVGTAYTACGGIGAVIWTDTVQIILVVGAAILSVVVLLRAIDLPLADLFAALAHAGPGGQSKLRVVDLSADLRRPFTLWTALAMTLFNMAAYGTDQDLVQRLLTCRSRWRGSASLIGAILGGLPVTGLFALIGLLLFVYYKRPDLTAAAAPADVASDPRRLYPQFLLHHMPAGLTGLAVAGLFAAAMSSFDSAINAMASTTVADLITPWRVRRKAGGGALRRERGRASPRWIVAGLGVLLTATACGAAVVQQHGRQGLIAFALGVMTFPYAGLLGVFLTALFTRRGNSVSVVAALIAGAMTVVFCKYATPLAFAWWMVAGTAVSFLVCFAGPPRRRREQPAARLSKQPGSSGVPGRPVGYTASTAWTLPGR